MVWFAYPTIICSTPDFLTDFHKISVGYLNLCGIIPYHTDHTTIKLHIFASRTGNVVTDIVGTYAQKEEERGEGKIIPGYTIRWQVQKE